MEQNTNAQTAPTHVWADYGMSWTEAVVSRDAGPNKSDRKPVSTKAQLPVVTDYEKFVEHFGKPTVLAFLNGSNSPRVKAQAVCRGLIEAGHKDAETIRLGVYNALRGIRAQAAVHTVTVTIVKVTLPDGTIYEGTDETEYQQAFAAALVGMGIEGGMAVMMAQNAKLPTA